MTAAPIERIRPVGVNIGLWSVAGAAAPTLVVASNRRLVDPLPVLETAVATIGRPVEKVALAHPAVDEPTAQAEYVFAQVVERSDGHVLDLTPECGHSMLATATHLIAADQFDGSRPIRLLTHRSGARRIVTCAVRADQTATDSYTAGLTFPFDESDDDFPLGRSPLVIDLADRPVLVTVIDCGNPYAFVDARDLDITDATTLFAARDELRSVLQQIRARLAPRLGIADSQVLPKPAVLLRCLDGTLCARSLSANGWHPGLALTGLVAIATLVADVNPGDTNLTVNHPGGSSTVGIHHGPDGTRSLTVADRRVVRLAMPPWER